MNSAGIIKWVYVFAWIGSTFSVFAQGDITPSWALSGICFSPFRANQTPDCGVFPLTAEIRQDLQFIKDTKFTPRIRTYSCMGTLRAIPGLCQNMGLECWPGAWLSRYSGPTEREIQALISVGKQKLTRSPVLIVGNEVLLRNDMNEQDLIAAIRRVKGETGLQVGYAEIGTVWMQHPELAKAVDVVIVHLYPYWDGTSIHGAVDSLVQQWQNLVQAFPGKRIVIGETGWPSGGERNKEAVPSEENQARYFKEFLQAARIYNMNYFYFSLFDESWKAKQEGQRGAHWGLFSENGLLKPLLVDMVPPDARAGMSRAPGVAPSAVHLSLPAFIYHEGDSRDNHFYPTNWMGDVNALKIDEYCTDSPHSGNECLQVKYTGQGTDRWAGVYWVGPYMNHWGEYPGYSVKGAKKLVFWARGKEGGENVAFSLGGLDSPGKKFHDSFGPLPPKETWRNLTSKWKQYSIDLAGADTSSLISGFCIVVNQDANPNGCTFYLDDIVLLAE